MQKRAIFTFAIITAATMSLASPQFAVARTSPHGQRSAAVTVHKRAPVQVIKGEKIPGAPNGMLVEMQQKWQAG